ncbi:Uncharacterised protein [Shigella flexneri]|nr:Uncharacterised protein [Shigella flexneri]
MVCPACDGRSVSSVVTPNCCHGCGAKKSPLYHSPRVAVCSTSRPRIGSRMPLRSATSPPLKKLPLARTAKRGRSGISA